MNRIRKVTVVHKLSYKQGMPSRDMLADLFYGYQHGQEQNQDCDCMCTCWSCKRATPFSDLEINGGICTRCYNEKA